MMMNRRGKTHCRVLSITKKTKKFEIEKSTQINKLNIETISPTAVRLGWMAVL